MNPVPKHIRQPFTDWQGNVTMTTDSRGHIEQHIGYYPYGEPWREPAGQRLKLYGGKERQSGVLAGDYDFGPRSLTFTTLFTAPDRAAILNPWVSPYSYCMGNPIRFIDPTGDIPTPYESALMSSATYKDKYYADRIRELNKHDWYISSFGSIQRNHNAGTGIGLQSMVFERKTKNGMEYAYVFAGTNCWEDGVEDAVQLVGLSQEYDMAIKNAIKLSKEVGSNELTFVGHSMGGGNAAAASMATGRAAITFNPAVVSSATRLRYGLSNPGNITNYFSSTEKIGGQYFVRDYVTMLQGIIGLSAPGKNGYIPTGLLPTHSINTIVDALNPKKTKK